MDDFLELINFLKYFFFSPCLQGSHKLWIAIIFLLYFISYVVQTKLMNKMKNILSLSSKSKQISSFLCVTCSKFLQSYSY